VFIPGASFFCAPHGRSARAIFPSLPSRSFGIILI
jgi:hypothetical protein